MRILFYLGNYTQLDWLCLNDNWGQLRCQLLSIREIPFCLSPNECSTLHWWAIQKEELTTNINEYINKKIVLGVRTIFYS